MFLPKSLSFYTAALVLSLVFTRCNNAETPATAEPANTDSSAAKTNDYLSQPLVSHIYTADPSAHVFNGRFYIYPSHDTATGTPENDNGDHFNMMDYHILSMDSIGGPVTDHGVALDIKNIPWAGRQLWAPDAAFANNTYYLYFPVKDKQDVFRIGVASSSKPEGPFVAEKDPLKGSYSIDPCVFKDDDGKYYLYFGGIWGGQLQRWNNNKYDAAGSLCKPEEPAILPRVARLSPDMKSFAEPVKEVKLVDEKGNTYFEKDNDKRFFEAAWLHKYKGKYYFSYSTGDTHNICYATGDSPYGPFTYKGILLKPVDGWTNHHSIVEKDGKWYLFYHDVQLSGKTHLRNVKVAPLQYNEDGTIQTLSARK
ncbi:family 43 glycosylhydrolase [Pseudoflavitalea sp. X16]|uniref:glycoside hydrolase family 43 protein n=1 Tax=Paraflavitalea devenefica TaxID=2716334 RepID=UPI001422F636|nr:glycoside hydrolase family 43 protein [Paraflavitalea devenefica]NII26243.1 family 43 glycosylhydrolase [Paraflavitalea devenefica]